MALLEQDFNLVFEFELTSIDEADGTCCVTERMKGQKGATVYGPMKMELAAPFIELRKAEITANINALVARTRSWHAAQKAIPS